MLKLRNYYLRKFCFFFLNIFKFIFLDILKIYFLRFLILLSKFLKLDKQLVLKIDHTKSIVDRLLPFIIKFLKIIKFLYYYLTKNIIFLYNIMEPLFKILFIMFSIIMFLIPSLFRKKHRREIKKLIKKLIKLFVNLGCLLFLKIRLFNLILFLNINKLKCFLI